MARESRKYDPEGIETKWQKVWAEQKTFVVDNPEPGSAPGGKGSRRHLRARDVPVPFGQRAHGARQELHHGRHHRPVPPPSGPEGAAPHGVRRLRPELGEHGHQDRRAAGQVHRRGHRHHQPATAPPGRVHRLDPRGGHLPARVLQVDPVALPAVLQEGAGLQEGGPGQLVPVLPDRAGQRAGGGRRLRALRHGGGSQEADAVVLPHHRLRRPAAPGLRQAGVVARAGHHHAAQLDRQVDGADVVFSIAPAEARRRGGRRPREPPPPRSPSSPPGPTRSSGRRSSSWRRSTRWWRSWWPGCRRRPRSSATWPRPWPPRTSSGPAWTRRRPASSPAATPSTRSPGATSPSTWPTTC